jgi:hypothetical protein
VRSGLHGSLDGDSEDLPFNTNASGCYNWCDIGLDI